MPEYNFKWLPELLWAVGIALAFYLVTILASWQNPDDWSAFGGAVVSGGARAAGAAALNVLRKVFAERG